MVEYIIEKVYSNKPRSDFPKRFPRIPKLYLELFENKSKIKHELVNKDYEPPEDIEFSSPPEQEPEIAKSESPAASEKSAESGSPRPLTDDENEDEASEKSPSVQSEVSTATQSTARSSSKDQLLKILGKSSTPPSARPKTPRVKTPASLNTGRRLPSLKELEEQNGYSRKKVVLDAEYIQDKDEDKKRDLLLKFDLLKKTYPRARIPEVSIHENYNTLERQYEDTLRNLSLDNSVDNYKQYLTFLFMGIEWFCGKVLKIDMKGYTDHQCEQMHKYEKFLIEIGQKNYIPSGKKWPVEVQLLAAVVIQTALFVFMRSVFKGVGANILKVVNEAKVPAAAAASEPRRRMRGPTVNLDDLPDAE